MARTQGSTAGLELTRAPGDRRLYHLYVITPVCT
jgi:hypothetical protein